VVALGNIDRCMAEMEAGRNTARFFILECPFFDRIMNHHADVNAFIPKWFGRRRGVIHHASFCRMPGAQ